MVVVMVVNMGMIIMAVLIVGVVVIIVMGVVIVMPLVMVIVVMIIVVVVFVMDVVVVMIPRAYFFLDPVNLIVPHMYIPSIRHSAACRFFYWHFPVDKCAYRVSWDCSYVRVIIARGDLRTQRIGRGVCVFCFLLCSCFTCRAVELVSQDPFLGAAFFEQDRHCCQ
jgi:hypothetical protein